MCMTSDHSMLSFELLNEASENEIIERGDSDRERERGCMQNGKVIRKLNM